MTTDRFNLRYGSFDRAFMTFVKILKKYNKDKEETNQMALIKSFEYVCELSWKLLKDYLYVKGIVAMDPRDATKHSYQQELIDKGEVWLKAI